MYQGIGFALEIEFLLLMRKSLVLHEEIKQDSESLKGDGKIIAILLFLADQIESIPKLREKYLEQDLSQMGGKDKQKLADEWLENWGRMLISVRSELLFVDCFAGVAQSVIKFRLQ